MKKVILVIGMMIAILIAGCSGSAVDVQEPVQTGSTSEPDAEQSESSTQVRQNAAEITQLLFGTFLLEGTNDAVTAEQAAQLLPLWKLYRSLLESDITATEEIKAVAKQITRKMTAEQLFSMEDQTFDREQMNAIMEELGIDTFSGAGRGEGFEAPDGFTPPDGFQPGQGRGPGGRPGGAEIDPEVMATRQAEMEVSGGFQRGFNLPLVEALIEVLEQRVG